MRLVNLLPFTMACALSGCGAQFVRQRAAFDFNCPEESIEVVDAGGGAVGALGCGKKASYLFVSGVGWTRNSEIQSGGVPAGAHGPPPARPSDKATQPPAPRRTAPPVVLQD